MGKLRNVLLLGASIAFFGTNALAAFSIDELVDVTKLSLKDFTTEHPDHVEHFTGYKSWKSGEDAKVKIYVNHDGMSMEYNYLCHKHDTGLECHAQ